MSPSYKAFTTGRLTPFQQSRLSRNVNPVELLPPYFRIQLDQLKDVEQATPPAVNVNALQYGSFNNVALSVGLANQLILPQPPGDSIRIFLLIVNTHATQNLFLRFQAEADAIIGLPILFNFGFVGFDTVVPNDDLNIIANGAATTGVMIYGNKSPQQSVKPQ